jgi:hypothetical protein
MEASTKLTAVSVRGLELVVLFVGDCARRAPVE